MLPYYVARPKIKVTKQASPSTGVTCYLGLMQSSSLIKMLLRELRGLYRTIRLEGQISRSHDKCTDFAKDVVTFRNTYGANDTRVR